MSRSSYGHTLCLPRSPLSARAHLAEREPETLVRWSQRDWMEEHARDPARTAPFVLHDGPPYANGPVHLGHLLNKCLKDFVVRSRAMAGHAVSWRLGWDCHGLPVERGVLMRQPELEGRPKALRQACHDWAMQWQGHQQQRFRRLLTMGGAQRYRTVDPDFEASVLEVFASLVEQDLVLRARRPVRWSLGNHTALAEAELDYDRRVDPSVWVDLELLGGHPFDVEGPVALTAWTTTPWTLPANVGVAVDADATYALTRSDRLRVVAADAVDRLAEALGTPVTVCATVPGAALCGHAVQPPFGGAGVVVASDHVDVGGGTGVVHLAPGHGPEDFEVGRAEGLPVRSVLDERGRLDDTVPEALRGLTPDEANPKVVAALRDRGRLAAEGTVEHMVPLDWRGGARVVYRATPQWFVALDRPTRWGPTLRETALAALDDVAFHPETGRQRLRSMVQGRPDWCVSRQRSWGVPVPVFYDGAGSPVVSAEAVRAVARVVRSEGGDAWFRRSPAALLQGVEMPGVAVEALVPGSDVLDVWFESGASWKAVLDGAPSDVVLEGSDQHRGWFQSSLWLAAACTGRAPYRTVVTHGFVVDADTRHKLSKSAGTARNVDDLFDSYGAEVLRWWAATRRFEADVAVSDEVFDTCGRAFRKLRDVLRYVVGNVGDLPEHARTVPSVSPTHLEHWLLEALAGLVAEVRGAYDRVAFEEAARALHRFCATTLSARFLPASRDRLYCDVPSSPRRRRAQQALFVTADALCRLLAPLLPHLADEVWRALHDGGPLASVHAVRFPEVRQVQESPAWAAAVAVKPEVDRALDAARERDGWTDPLDAGLGLSSTAPWCVLDPDDLAAWFGVSRVVWVEDDAPQVVDLRDAPRCARSRRRTEDVRLRESGEWLSDRDAAALASQSPDPSAPGSR